MYPDCPQRRPHQPAAVRRTPTPFHPSGAAKGWATFRDTQLTARIKAIATKMDLGDQRDYLPKLEMSVEEAHPWHIHDPTPQNDRGGRLFQTPTRPRKPRQATTPVSASRNRVQHPCQDPGRTAPHRLTSRTLMHPANYMLPNAHHRHHTAAPHPTTNFNRSKPHMDHHSPKAKGYGATSDTSTPPLPPPTASQAPNNTTIPTTSLTTMRQYSRDASANQPTQPTGPHVTILCTTDMPTATIDPCLTTSTHMQPRNDA